jgi:magnesium transporter
VSHRKRKHRRRRKQAVGVPPESAAVDGGVSNGATPPAMIKLTAFGATGAEERSGVTAGDLAGVRRDHAVVWIDVEGLDDTTMNQSIGRVFDISELALEDAVTPDERPKLEAFGHQLLVAVRTARYEEGLVVTDPVCIFLGEQYVITFRDRLAVDPFDGVRARVRAGRTKVGVDGDARSGADALCSLLLDAVIDGYFPVLEQFGDRLESLEDEAINSPSRSALVRIHDVRNDLMTLRRALWPSRDVLHALSREPTPLVGEHARAHFRDTYDHTMELLDLMESYREIGSDLRDIYLASLNNRMNDVMKVLAVIATIFMPLTFITGYYGMNFDTESPWNMPLLRFRYGGPIAIGMMLLTTLGMVVFFWRRGWLKRWH